MKRHMRTINVTPNDNMRFFRGELDLSEKSTIKKTVFEIHRHYYEPESISHFLGLPDGTIVGYIKYKGRLECVFNVDGKELLEWSIYYPWGE